jgi:hypothetical protein
MRVVMKIKDFIKQAEYIFIGGNSFDDERVAFIENLEICDLLAVPGSGKTTALIAKLYCIAQNMPFEDGSGILVLAHTNHAVEEIEKKLKKHCPQLFDYPNYVGTIQGFVNKFLTIPYYVQKNKKRCRVIDDSEYKEQWDFHLNYIKDAVAYFKFKNLSLFYNSRLNLCDDGKIFICVDNTNEEIKPKCPSKWETNGTKNDKTSEVKKFIQETKIKIFTDGLLHYDDCYFYAKQYLFNFPEIKIILKNRFKYVFIDEMQDLEEYQIKIIDDIFYDENSKTVIQRIGDINQSIYGSGKKVKVECAWQPRSPKYLNNSHRLTKEVARLVNCFTLDPQIGSNGHRFKVEGLRTLDNPIKPHLILFDQKTTGEELQNKFETLIKNYKLYETDSGKKNGFKIIGWSTVWENDEQKKYKNGNVKIRLKDLFPDYSKESNAKKEHFDCLKKYLHLYDHEKKTFEAVRKSILNALVQVLRLEGILKAPNIPYRKSSLIEFIKDLGTETYNDFIAKLFKWCFDLVVKKNFEKVYIEIKQFIENYFIKWNWQNETDVILRSINKAKDFIDSKNYTFQSKLTKETIVDVKEINPYNVEINSVHAVKGQTHCATMYVETAYKKPVYETLKIKENSLKRTKKTSPFFFEPHSCEGLEAKNALKMMYVGFSRPTHLLCFAALNDNIGDIKPYEDAGWEVISDLILSSVENGENDE